jgi:hypothetical protein
VGYIDVITGLDEFSEGGKAFVYPNPFNDGFYVSSLESIEKLDVLNVFGQECKSMIAPENIDKIDLSGFEAGIYFVLVYKGSGVSTFKVLKE